MLFEFAHQMAFLPLFWLAGLRVRGNHRDIGWWFLALAFAVSWVADSAVDLGAAPWLVSTAYPVSQAALVGAVLLDRKDALVLSISLSVVGLLAVSWHRLTGPDLLLSTVASLSVAGIAFEYTALGRLRWCLLVSFGATWACWMAYAATPGYPTYLAYHAMRLLGLVLFCWATLETGPRLTLARA